MKHRLFFTLGIIVLSMVSVTTSPAQLQQAQPQPMQAAPAVRPVLPAPGPYYATPSWSQKLPANVRFIVLSDWDNAAVLDKETGLVWERTPSLQAKRMYDVAFMHCLESKVGNRFGWRLPKAHELGSLMDPSVTSYPMLPPGHPFSMPHKEYVGQHRYWTSDVLPFATQLYITITPDYTNARYKGYTLRESHSGAWCVRGPGELY